MKAKSKKAWVGACHVIAVPAWRRSAGLAGPLFGPTPEHELFRVMFKEPDEAGTWAWTSRTGQTETEAWEKFAQIVEAFEAHTAVPVRRREQRDRTIEALFELYIADSKERGKAVRTVEGRESKGRAHIIPTIGDLPVAQWRPEHTREGWLPGASTRSTDWSSPGCPASTFPSTAGLSAQVEAMASAADLVTKPGVHAIETCSAAVPRTADPRGGLLGRPFRRAVGLPCD